MGCSGIAATEDFLDGVGTAIDMHVGTLGRTVDAILGSIGSTVATAKDIGEGIGGGTMSIIVYNIGGLLILVTGCLIDIHLGVALRRTGDVVGAIDIAMNGGSAGVGGILSPTGGTDVDDGVA